MSESESEEKPLAARIDAYEAKQERKRERKLRAADRAEARAQAAERTATRDAHEAQELRLSLVADRGCLAAAAQPRCMARGSVRDGGVVVTARPRMIYGHATVELLEHAGVARAPGCIELEQHPDTHGLVWVRTPVFSATHSGRSGGLFYDVTNGASGFAPDGCWRNFVEMVS
jgi:hypothetical protein